MDLGSVMIGIGGLVLAILTTYISYQQHKDDRKSKYRDALYSRQIEACQNISQLAAEYLYLIRNIHKSELNAIGLPEQIEKVVELQRQLSNKYSEYVIFVTNRMHKAFNVFIVVSRDATHFIEAASIKNDSEDSKVKIQAFESQIRDSYYELIESMREIIGTERFNKETLTIIKK